jgi:hypothetical protein
MLRASIDKKPAGCKALCTCSNQPCKHTIGHILDGCLLRGAVIKTYRVANLLPKPTTEFLRHTFCHRHGCYTTRLSACNTPLHAGKSVPVHTNHQGGRFLVCTSTGSNTQFLLITLVKDLHVHNVLIPHEISLCMHDTTCSQSGIKALATASQLQANVCKVGAIPFHLSASLLAVRRTCAAVFVTVHGPYDEKRGLRGAGEHQTNALLQHNTSRWLFNILYCIWGTDSHLGCPASLC